MRCTMSILLTVLVHIGFAAEYYVDPTGDDSNDGCAATPGELGVGPKKTLQGAMGITGLTSGDIVHAAAGDYDLGEAWASSSSNRVVIPAGVGLVATNAALTRIIGKKSEQNLNGLGTDAVRCVYLNSGSYVRNFTITRGRTPTGTSVNGGGVMSSGGAAIDCIFTDNGCGNRGTAVSGGTCIRCMFRGNSGTAQGGAYAAYFTSYLISCVFPKDGGDVAYGNGQILNCWLAGGNTWGTVPSPVYNSYIYNSGWKKAYTNCVFGCAESAFNTDSVYDPSTCVFGKDVSTLHIDAEYRPLMTETVLIDKGSNANYEAVFPAAWLQFKDQDYAGGIRRIGEIDIGPGEFNWRNSIRSSNGLDIVYADLGEGVVKVSVSRNYTSEKLCLGFIYNGETILFADYDEGYVWEKVMGTNDQLVPIYKDVQTDWYVNAETGNDTNRGYAAECPRKTLVSAMLLPLSGHVVHAAPGIYDEGLVEANTSSRVVVPAGVGLVADEGPAVTAIVGYTPIYTNAGTVYIGGAGSVRCVALGENSYVKGFTLRDGATAPTLNSVYGDTGGGVYGGTVIDCIITNCCAVRGGGAASATLIRCFVSDCKYVTGTNNLGQLLLNAGQGVYQGSAYDSYLDSLLHNISPLVGCYVYSVRAIDGYRCVYNCYCDNDSGYLAYTNCIVTTPSATAIVGANTVVGSVALDPETKRPLAGQTLAIDRGDLTYATNYPAAFASEWGKDLAGGQRVYNGKIDIGCGEFDWRDTYSASLNRRQQASVAVATVNVTNAEDGVVMSGGDRLEVDLVSPTDGACSFTVAKTGDGSVTAMVGDLALVPDASGIYSFRGIEGTNRVVLTYAGEGTAKVSGFTGAMSGTLIQLR